MHVAYNYDIIPEEHYNRRYDEVIKNGSMEVEWCVYKFSEIFGIEKRVEKIIENFLKGMKGYM